MLCTLRQQQTRLLQHARLQCCIMPCRPGLEQQSRLGLHQLQRQSCSGEPAVTK